MFNRYKNTQIIINNSKIYEEVFEQKKVNNIRQYSTFDMNGIISAIKNLPNRTHIVQPYEKLDSISQYYYERPEYGWLICLTNKISNELQIEPGLLLRIYFPLATILERL